jgi:hypothetical protein
VLACRNTTPTANHARNRGTKTTSGNASSMPRMNTPPERDTQICSPVHCARSFQPLLPMLGPHSAT